MAEDRFVAFPYTTENAESFIRSIHDPTSLVASGDFDPATSRGTGPLLSTHYSICLNGKAIGGIGCNFMSDIRMRTAALGYWIGEDYWYQGILSTVAPAFVRFMFRSFGRLMQLESLVYEGNRGSCRVLEKCGFEYAYLSKKGVWKDGQVINADVYQMPRPDE